VGYNLFQRHGPGDDPASEFAATVATLPPGVELRPAYGKTGLDSVPSGSYPEDSMPPQPDSALPSTPPEPASDFGGDSLPAPEDGAIQQQPTLSQVGRYALKGPLGHGGLGQVHEAWDPLLSRTVAVKTLQLNVDTPSRVSLDGLFLNEARAAAGLSHPHIVTVHDAGLSAHGVYIAMERLYGRDLRHALADGWRPTPSQSAQLVRRVADALAYAHARGVVHCDIKPANIFLTKRDKPKVLDFGIARVAHRSAASGMDGLVMGSPYYLAPEQLQGGNVDARTDIHALGVVFYELLTGRRAFTGDTVEQITSAVLTNHPAPAHELRPGLPRTLSAIAAKAMARDPDERYTTAAEMASDLRHWLDRHAADTDPTTQPQAGSEAPPAASAPAKAPRSRMGLAVVALLVLGGVAATLVLRSPDGDPPASTLAAPATAPAPTIAAAPAPATVPIETPAPPAPTSPPPATPAGGDAALVATAVGAATALAPTPAAAAASGLAAPAKPRPAAATPRPAKAAPAAPARESKATAAPAAPPVQGQVQFAISPWGQVEVDGKSVGTTPPLSRLNLNEGTHTITVRNEDFPPYTTTVQVSADKPATVRHRFGQ
jgi:hypothetical protein